MASNPTPPMVSPPSPTPTHKRRSSVTLTPRWSEQGQPRPVIEESDEKVEALVAFFPLPTLEPKESIPRRASAPGSPRALGEEEISVNVMLNRRSVMFGSFRGKTTRDEAKVDVESSSSDDEDNNSINSTDMKDLAEVFWEDVPEAPADAILGIAQAYRECEHPNKVNVCVGAYRDENGKPWVLPSVRQAERVLLDKDEIKEYLPIDGDKEFVQLAMRFAYGQDMPMDHLAGVQTLSGTGACRVGGIFCARFWPNHPIYVPTPTWGNHITIFREAGLVVRKYRYYDRASNGLHLKGMLRDIKNAPKGSIILLHACAHNPTGCDPTIEEWQQIISAIRHKEHVAFFDSAYQGFASGDAEEDAQPFRYAVSQHVPIILAQSFAKNFGLYGERCGTLSVVCGDVHQKQRILSELRTIIRPMYSSPPRHGSSIVKTILNDETLKPQYYLECAKMSARIRLMRTRLVEELAKAGSKHDWSHVTKQIGMFAFTGMTMEMCQQLTKEYAIFLTMNGRISMAGLNESNIEYVAKAIHAVTDGLSITGE